MPRSIRISADQDQAIAGTRKMLKAHQLFEYVERLNRGMREAAEQQPAVVVVGEVKRGKSSLVNALTGRDVSPVDVEVATAAFLRVVPPSDDLPDGTWALVGPDGRRPVPAPEAAAFLRAGPGEDEAESAEYAEVAADSRWLPTVTLVDTPGVGGLESAHTRLASWAAARAGVLLMVTDAGQVLTAPELRFLQEAAQGVETVVFAVTKSDRYPDGGGQILAENAALLRTHAPRFAGSPMLAVSASLAAEAGTVDGDPEIRELLERESNLPALAQVLRERTADARTVGLANVLRVAITGLDRLTGDLQGRRRGAAGSPDGGDPVQAERDALTQLRLRERRWRSDLDRDLLRFRQSAIRDAGRLLDDVRDRWKLRISKEWSGVTEDGARQLLGELRSELRLVAAHVSATVQDGLVATLAEQIGGVDAAVAVLRPVTADFEIELTPGRRGPDMSSGMLDPSLASSAVMGAGMATRLGVIHATGATIFGPMGLLFGGAWFLVNLGMRRLRVGRQRLEAALNESLAVLRGDLAAGIDAAIRDCRPEVGIAVEDQLRAEIARVTAVIQEAERHAKASAHEREQEVAAVDRELAAVATQRDLVVRELALLARPGTSAASAASHSR
ncbi:dynamin family protein [Krasilnikovia cinnamomea]|uniref:Dynamin family protein n=1 Tax=Krasilnikovia cinnamomea TaxID=349313 RepID=A0A4Q7ZSI9_9ACTN|nr:dynamin family protein [Krasilnikovia cinnamomea]RZU54150.1 dynamin family protein [Krasilnikovia cinnamomea]